MTVRKPPKPYKTRDARPSVGTMIKPGELIDFVEMTPLSLVDRRTFNLLIAHAWDRIDQPVTHVMAKSELRGLHESNDRIGDSVERLMAAIVRTHAEIDGKPAIQRTQLLGSTTESRAPDGLLYYQFSAEMRAIVRDSNIFARLQRDVILHLSSRYSLALYELIQRRGNLDLQRSEELTVERLRQLLGVEPGRLEQFKHLNTRAIQPAVAEVNGLSDFGCAVEPVLAGRKAVKVKLSWWKKNADELKAAYREMQAAKVGRMARLKGTVEEVVPPLGGIADTTPQPPPTAMQRIQTAREAVLKLLEVYAELESVEPATLVGTLAEKQETIEEMERACQQVAAIAIPPETHSGEEWDEMRETLPAMQRLFTKVLEELRRTGVTELPSPSDPGSTP